MEGLPENLIFGRARQEWVQHMLESGMHKHFFKLEYVGVWVYVFRCHGCGTAHTVFKHYFHESTYYKRG